MGLCAAGCLGWVSYTAALLVMARNDPLEWCVGRGGPSLGLSYSHVPSAVFLAVFIIAAMNPLLWEWCGNDVTCSKPYESANSLKGHLLNCGPLSDLKMAGMPCSLKISFNILMITRLLV